MQRSFKLYIQFGVNITYLFLKKTFQVFIIALKLYFRVSEEMVRWVKALVLKAWWPVLDSGGGRRERIPQICLLTSTSAMTWMFMPVHTYHMHNNEVTISRIVFCYDDDTWQYSIGPCFGSNIWYWNSIMNLVYIFNGKIFRVPWTARAGSHEPAEDLDQCSSMALLTLNF